MHWSFLLHPHAEWQCMNATEMLLTNARRRPRAGVYQRSYMPNVIRRAVLKKDIGH